MKKQWLTFGFLLWIAMVSCTSSLALALTFSNFPLELNYLPYSPNVLILYDNSNSMEININPSVPYIGGADSDSRANVVRRALVNILNTYHGQLNWGIETFDTYGSEMCLDGNSRCGVYRLYTGSASTMNFTNDCVGGYSNTAHLSCTTNPEPANGYNYVTYEKILPSNLIATYYKDWFWGVVYESSGWAYGALASLFDHHNPAPNNSTWRVGGGFPGGGFPGGGFPGGGFPGGGFPGGGFPGGGGNPFGAGNPFAGGGSNPFLNATGYGPMNDFKDPFYKPAFGNPVQMVGGYCSDSGGSACPAQLMLGRLLGKRVGWSFHKQVNGLGAIIEDIQTDFVLGHYQDLLDVLAPEVSDLNSKEIKNNALETPLMGSFITAKNYFSGSLPGHGSPIQSTCQKNYVLLATDGQPTVDSAGNYYSLADYSTSSSKAYTDLYAKINDLHTTSHGLDTFDIQTYVLGIGDIVYNSIAVDGLNKMAEKGGTNQSYLATNSDELMSSFQDIVHKIQLKTPIRQSNGHYTLNNAKTSDQTDLYKTFFSAQGNVWQGNITSSNPKVSFVDGQIVYDTGNLPNDFTTGAARWLTNDTVNGQSRNIITAVQSAIDSPLKGVAFQWDNLGTYTQNLLVAAGTTTEKKLNWLNYIRGNRLNENASSDGFRTRGTTVLGDIVNSSPVYVSSANTGYSDSDFPTGFPSYYNFVVSQTNRRPMIYVGANDGMLHGFDANTLQEVFAFIPNSVLSKLIPFSSSSYTHDFFVDETPVIAEVPVGDKWTTQLIGFPGIGGTGLFALDITSPDALRPETSLIKAERNASKIILWELNGQIDHDIGYIINHGPINQQRGGISGQIGRFANKHWAIATGNGYNSYNNTTGLVISYLDSTNAIPPKKIMIPKSESTGGLSAPTLVDTDSDGLIDYAYAGDLQGNVWRFDLRGAEDDWKAFKLFTVDSIVATPITAAPVIARHCLRDGLMIIVGTGKYLESSDNYPAYQVNRADYLVGLWDKLDSNVISRNDLVEQNYSGTYANTYVSAAQKLLVSSNKPVDWTFRRGWILPLNFNDTSPARILKSPYIVNNILYFNTSTPDSSQACQTTSFAATVQALNYCNGSRPEAGVFDINFDGQVDSNDSFSLGGASSVNVTGVMLNNQTAMMDSSVWITPNQFSCATPPCNAFSTGLSGPIGIDMQKKQVKRVSWKQIDQ